MSKQKALELDDEPDDRPRYKKPQRKGVPVWALLAAVAVFSFASLVAGFAIGRASARTAGAQGNATETQGAGTRKALTCDEFSKEFQDKTADEIIAALGKPDSVDPARPGRAHQTWTYSGSRKLAVEPISGKHKAADITLYQEGGVWKARSFFYW